MNIKKIKISYYQNNKRHRLDGPADIWYDKYGGNIEHESYYVDGVEYEDIFLYSVAIGSLSTNIKED